MDDLTTPLITLFLTIDPPGLAPLFLGVTRGMTREQRGQVAARACLTASGVLLLFALAGTAILDLFGITLPAFRIAGGLLLFWIAFEMIYERRQDRQEKSAQRATAEHVQSVAIFPLAIPLIAGPGAISATILLAAEMGGTTGRLTLIAELLLMMALTFGVFLLAHRVDKILGETGRAVLTRLLGVMLAALAVQFVADGAVALAAAANL